MTSKDRDCVTIKQYQLDFLTTALPLRAAMQLAFTALSSNIVRILEVTVRARLKESLCSVRRSSIVDRPLLSLPLRGRKRGVDYFR